MPPVLSVPLPAVPLFESICSGSVIVDWASCSLVGGGGWAAVDTGGGSVIVTRTVGCPTVTVPAGDGALVLLTVSPVSGFGLLG